MPATWQSQNVDPATSSGDSQLIVTAPSGIAVGDLLLGIGGCVASRTIAPNSAGITWTQQLNNSSGGRRLYVWTRIATATDVSQADYRYDLASFSQAIVSVHRISGASTNAPTIQWADGSNSTSQTTPTLASVIANSLVLWGAYSTTNLSSTANKGTERTDQGNSSSGCWMSVYSNLEATGGSISGATLTLSGSTTPTLFSIAIESAAVTGRAPKPTMVIGL